MTETDFESLLSDDPSPGEGALIGIQGDAGTGKSTLAANADDPVLYLVLDPNSRALGQNLPTNHRISWAHVYPPAGNDVALADRTAWLERVNKIWNGFLSGVPSKFGPPYKSFVWDTATRLWDGVYPTKVGEKLAGKTREPGPLDYATSNDWMRQISLSRASLRPDAFVLVLLHEQTLYVPDPDKPDSTFRVAHATKKVFDGWKETARDLNFFVRLIRKEEKVTVTEAGIRKVQTQLKRYGVILKHPNEKLLGMEIPEPTWQEIKEWL